MMSLRPKDDPMSTAQLISSVRPEVRAGGIARDDGEIHFFVRVNALLADDMTVVDYGCGRGAVFDSGEFVFRERLAKLQGKVRKVIGIDVDETIFEHPYLDERHLLAPTAPLPVDNKSIDLIVAHWVLEHISDPEHTVREFWRILKPRGWLIARTLHRWSYVGLAAQIVPDRLQFSLLRVIKPGILEKDKFPTAYKLNSFGALRRHFPSDRWRNYSYGLNVTPRYHFNNRLVFRTMSALQHVLWPKTDLIILVQKRTGADV